MKRTEAYRQFIEDKLRERYPTFLLHGRTSFQAPDGTILRIDTLKLGAGSTGSGIRLR